jgi:hypothetical protein
MSHKAVIFLNKSFLDINQKTLQNLNTSCNEHKLEIIKTIYNDHKNSTIALDILVQLIKEQQQPLTVIIDPETYLLAENILPCCFIGTLLKIQLIKLCIYQEIYQEKKQKINSTLFFYRDEIPDLLSASTIHLSQLQNKVNNSHTELT